MDARSGRIERLWTAPLRLEEHPPGAELGEPGLLERLASVARDLQERGPTAGRRAVTGVQGEDVACGYLELPGLKSRDLEFAIPSAVARELPYRLDEVVLASVPVPPLHPDHRGGAWFYVAVRTRRIEGMQERARALGVEVRELDVPALGLARQVGLNRSLPGQEFFALVHAGHRYTQVVLVRDGSPYYHREFVLAGRDFTYAYQMAYQSDWKDAEQRKREGDATRREVAVEPFLRRWLAQVAQSVSHFATRAGVRVAGVLLSGGSALWTGLDRRLEEALDVPVQVDRWERQQVAPGAPVAAPVFNLAAGLAVSA